MPMMSGLIGCGLMLLAVIHAFIPNDNVTTMLYAGGAALAFLTVKRDLSIIIARVLAVATTALMFFYFACFFELSLAFNEHWYYSGAALDAVGLLFAAFGMIAVLAEYSCILKADCHERVKAGRRRAFFSVPQGIEDHSTS